MQELSSCGFTVVPQINLASVINKTSNGRWHNELFHNIDFGIFDEGFNILLLVELNDSSHNRPDRIERDFKVRDIAAAASIPFITFYTNKTKGFYVINSILDKLRLYRSDLPEYPWGREL